MASLPAPEGLADAGRALWSRIADPVAGWDLRPDELAVLERACRVADRLAMLDSDLAARIEADPIGGLVSRGSMGQEVEAPVLASLVRHDALLQRLLSSLKLPDLQTGESSTSQAARKAAQARWSKPRSA